MLIQRCFLLVVSTFFVLQALIGSANAASLVYLNDFPVRLNEAGDTTVLSEEEYVLGERLFGDTCILCHVGGQTKMNPSVGLGEEALTLATPPRNHIEGLVDYLNNPTTYDGEIEIYEFHPSTRGADMYPEMKDLTQDDLYAIAGYILAQQKLAGDHWGERRYVNP